MKACLKWVLAMAFAALGGGAHAKEMHALRSGQQVEILYVRSTGDQPAYTLKYRTSHPPEPAGPVRKEADQLWDHYLADVERSGHRKAVIGANYFERGVILTTRKFRDFLFEKKDGSWRTVEFDAAAPAKLDEAFLREFVDRIDAAQASGALNALSLYMADGWTATETAPGDGEGRAETLDRKAFTDRLGAASGAPARKTRKREITRVSIADNGAGGQVESVLSETVTADGREVSSVRRVTDFFEARDRSALWTKSESVAGK